MLELPYDAQNSMQQLGRTHRSDQHNAPKYVLVTSNLFAEKRFAATVSKRAADLGAATTGDRRGANEEKAFGSDILIGGDAIEGVRKTFAALGASFDWPVWCEARGDWNQKSAEMKQLARHLGLNAMSQPKQLLGRCLGIPLEHSNDVMHLFESACMQAALDSAKLTSDVGVEDIIIGEKTKVVYESTGGAVTISTDIGITFDDVMAKAQSWQTLKGKAVDPKDGIEKPINRWKFFGRFDQRTGRTFNVMAQLEKPRVRITRPNGRTGLHYFKDFKANYTGIDSVPGARAAWDAEYALCLKQCTHGPSCKDPHCDFGKRCVTSTIVKMPGALNTLCEYKGARQLLRFNDSTGAVFDRCVAVRLGTDRVSVEDKLVAEKNRQEAVALKATQAKQATAAALEKRSADLAAVAAASNAVDADADDEEGDGFVVDDDDEEEDAAVKSSEDEDDDSDNSDSDDDAPSWTGKRVARPMRRAGSAAASKLAAALGESSDDDKGYDSDDVAPVPKKRGAVGSAGAASSKIVYSDEE